MSLFCFKFISLKSSYDSRIPQGNAALLFPWGFQAVKCEGSYSRKNWFEMEVKSNLHYSLQRYGSPNAFCRELANASAHRQRKGHECGNNLTKSYCKWWLMMQTPLAHICEADPTSPLLSWDWFLSLLYNRSFPLPKFCLVSGKSSQYGRLKRESHAVVIISLFRNPSLNLSDCLWCH